MAKRVLDEQASAFVEAVSESAAPYVEYKTAYRFMNDFNYINLPTDYFMYELDTGSNALIHKQTRFQNAAANEDNIDIPDKLTKGYYGVATKPGLNSDNYMFPFSYFGANRIMISQELSDEMYEYNEKMLDVYEDMSTHLKHLVNTIQSCKSTKKFESLLPDLTSLYPKSLMRKINNKNEVDSTLTKSQIQIETATSYIATANLLSTD